MEQRITVRNNQSLIDIALQETGSLQAVADLMLQNELSVTDDLTPGGTVVLTEVEKNVDVKGYYKSNKVRPATAIPQTATKPNSGISVWGIKKDFKVSKS